MSLLDRSKKIKEKKLKLKELRTWSAQTDKLRNKSVELSTKLSKLSGAVDTYHLYVEENIPLIHVSKDRLNHLRNKIDSFKSQFEGTPDTDSILNDTTWPDCFQQITLLTNEVVDNCKNGWDDFSREYFIGHTPQTLEGSIVRTDENLKLYQEFESLYWDLKSLVKEGEFKESIKAFKVKGDRLLEIAKTLDSYEAPEGVRKFLNAISNGGAPLELFTREVREWLQENDLYSKFKIIGDA